ncbi:DUF4268 domain-containing protein [Aphanothece minutissima]|uniref:DUF4268 domain-containing protein n=1 Tax=Aphanothece cf. minutissima CCALA 015 TaxID=2107695 RepID=A0ABX5F918_9CHRO|nr:DUF4268 domain-containing protein [Aphanothece minutissima]PSB38162.1 hypothetical protein C7B81_05505 [Aphanothece cf. minutissima CCALA 015]
MSAFTQPIIIQNDGSALSLQRLPLKAGVDGQVDEAWLQQALYRAPESLPVKEIDPHIGPLIPICMELSTEAGPADILFVTPTGQIVLVETKLWRNPEARRQVVGQILDYAKQLTGWRYEDLDARAGTAAGTSAGHIVRALKESYPDTDEAQFVDGVRRSLSTGDFLLLIVGDGIRFGAEALVTFLEQYGNLRFGLALLEVGIYRLPDGSTLVQPRVLAKTEILERTILIGPGGPMSYQQAAEVEDTTEANAGQREWFMAFWREYLSKLHLPDLSLLPREPAKSTNQYFPMPPSGSLAWLSAYIAKSSRKAGVYLTFAKVFDYGPEIYESLLADRQEIEAEMGVTLSWKRDDNKVWIGVPHPTYSDLNNSEDRERVTTYLANMTTKMIACLEPRLQAAIKALHASG